MDHTSFLQQRMGTTRKSGIRTKALRTKVTLNVPFEIQNRHVSSFLTRQHTPEKAYCINFPKALSPINRQEKSQIKVLKEMVHNPSVFPSIASPRDIPKSSNHTPRKSLRRHQRKLRKVLNSQEASHIYDS